MAELFTNPARATDSGNTPLPGAKLYFYTTGTTTPASVYTTSALSVAHPNPVVADSAGQFPAIYLDPTVNYRAVCKDSTGATTVYDIDPVSIGLSGSTGSAGIGFLQSGTGAVARTVQDKLRDFVSVSDFADLAAAVARSSNRLVVGPSLFRQEQKGVADYLTNYIHRTANYTGGTAGYVNSALKVETDIGAGNTNYEWGIVGVVNNSATAGENTAIYGQGNKLSTGPTWAMVAEARDKTGTANPAAGLIGIEVDVFANGTDSSASRVAVDIVGGRHNGAGTRADIGYGIRIAPQNFDTANAKFLTGFQMRGLVGTGIDFEATGDIGILFGASSNVSIGIDFSQGTVTGAALKFSRGQRICSFESGGGVVLDNIGAFDGLLAFKVSGTETVGLDLTNAKIRINGTQVIGSRATGWTAATGTPTRSTFATSTVTTTQLAERVKALIDDLIAHGLIGA